jgi:hypothetical protein
MVEQPPLVLQKNWAQFVYASKLRRLLVEDCVAIQACAFFSACLCFDGRLGLGSGKSYAS